jgi:hypothetical protein
LPNPEGNMNFASLKTAGIVVAILLLAAAGAMAQERAAQLTKVDGPVSITRVTDGSVDQATQMGPRVKNGSVFAGDVVKTDSGAKATLVFSDGSELKLEPQTSLTISEVDLSTVAAAAAEGRTTGRRIKVLAGKVWADVVPGSAILTEFETPSGVAAVKGTSLSIEVEPQE